MSTVDREISFSTKTEVMNLNVIVTVKSFGVEWNDWDTLIPMMETTMESVVNKLAELDDPKIDLTNLRSIHFTENYCNELFAFQRSVGIREYATSNKIGRGYAQVVYVDSSKSNELSGYHIFCDKMIPAVIMIGQFVEDHSEQFPKELIDKICIEKKQYLRVLRHELAHVEDENNQRNMDWIEHAFDSKSVKTLLQSIALRLWEEYYACKRSSFGGMQSLYDDFTSLVRDLDIAETEICDMRWNYNNMKMSLDDFVTSLIRYIRMALICCCYFMGHYDLFYNTVSDILQWSAIPSRFTRFIPELWCILRDMNSSYPNWTGIDILDNLSEIIKECINCFEIHLRNEGAGIYYEIPPIRLLPMRDEKNRSSSHIM